MQFSDKIDQLQEAFNNIIAQCVQSGRGGGEWNWVKDGVNEHYQLQTII